MKGITLFLTIFNEFHSSEDENVFLNDQIIKEIHLNDEEDENDLKFKEFIKL